MEQDEFLNNHSTGEEIILARHNGQNFSIILKNILFCEAEGNYTNVYIKGDQRLVVICRRLFFLERRLRRYHEFLRCHKTYIVNLNEVNCFCSQNKTLIISEYEIPVAKRKWNEIMRLLLEKGLRNPGK